MALVYDTEPAEEIDVRTQVPNQIIVLPHSQAPKLILDALQEKLPHRRFELLRPAANQDGCLDPEWEELSEKTQRALPADVLRIKAVRNGISGEVLVRKMLRLTRAGFQEC